VTRAVWLALAWLLVAVHPAAAQVPTPNTVGAGGGGGGTVAQGTAAATTDAAAWPIKIVFGSTQVDPRDVSDRAARALGKITFDGAQAVSQSGSWSFSLSNFPTTASTSAVAVRCVNTAGNAFESCAGSGGGGTLGQAVMASSSPVVIASDQSAIAVSGTFWQATQPVSGPLTDTQLRASVVPVSLASVPSHAVTNAGTFAVQVTSAPTTAVTGTFWQTTQPVSLASVPAHDVGSITTAITPGTAAANLGKAEDAAHASGDTGVMPLLVRKDSNSQLTSADGDYSPQAADAYGTTYMRSDHPNRIRCSTSAVSTAITVTALGGSCAAPGAGLSLYITDISFATSAAAATGADTFPTLKYGTGGTCGTGTTIFWGALTTANSTVVANLTTPIKIPANNEVCWIMTTAGSKFVVLTGFIAP
jgi:hypothetical protein